jgi:hypothetical protein
MASTSSDDDHTWVFSYGSNSTVQLSGRVENPSLKAFPAIARGWERIFCVEKTVWGVGGVASIVQAESCCVYGAAIRLAPAELSRLDGFECPVYERVDIDIDVSRGEGEGEDAFEPVRAVVYRNKTPLWRGPPSQQYLTAIHLMLREQWARRRPEALTIRICGLMEDEGQSGSGENNLVLFEKWEHPGTPCLTLSALCVEVNSRRRPTDPSQAWVMPRTINEIRAKLAAVGVHSAAQLAVHVSSRARRERLNAMLTAKGQKQFNANTLKIFAELLELSEEDV